jgi:hypothetical protein
LQQLADAVLGLGELQLQRADLPLHAVDLLVGVARLAGLRRRGLGLLAGAARLLALGGGGLERQPLLPGAALHLREVGGVVDQLPRATVALLVEAVEPALRPFQGRLLGLGAHLSGTPLDLGEARPVGLAEPLAGARQRQGRVVGDLGEARRPDADDLAGDGPEPAGRPKGGAVHRGGGGRDQQHAVPGAGQAGHGLGHHPGRVRPGRRPDDVEPRLGAGRAGRRLLRAQARPGRHGGRRRVEHAGLEALGQARLLHRLQRAGQGAKRRRRVGGGRQAQLPLLRRAQHHQGVALLQDHLGDRQALVAVRHELQVAQGGGVHAAAAQVHPVVGGSGGWTRALGRRRLRPGRAEVDPDRGGRGRLQLRRDGRDHLAQPRWWPRRGPGRPPRLRPGNGSTRRWKASAGIIARFADARQADERPCSRSHVLSSLPR